MRSFKLPTSASGTKRTSKLSQPMSAIGGKADIPSFGLITHFDTMALNLDPRTRVRGRKL